MLHLDPWSVLSFPVVCVIGLGMFCSYECLIVPKPVIEKDSLHLLNCLSALGTKINLSLRVSHSEFLLVLLAEMHIVFHIPISH